LSVALHRFTVGIALHPAASRRVAALAETTPGPLIIVLAFVGFMASYHHFHGSIFMGTIGLVATTFYTFSVSASLGRNQTQRARNS
jgi:hypothetical protein